MKKFFNLAMCLMAFVFSGMLTSCDEDVITANTLSGEWYGDFGMYYNYEYRGRVYTFDSFDTRIVFYPDYDYATHGWGKQVDYYAQGPYEYQYYDFYWNIRMGAIQITYPYDPALNTTITNYSMSLDRFSGRFGDSTDRFNLRKIADFYDWSPYGGSYGYYDRASWSGYYYAPTRAESDSLSCGAVTRDGQQVEGQVISRGNRFTTAQ